MNDKVRSVRNVIRTQCVYVCVVQLTMYTYIQYTMCVCVYSAAYAYIHIHCTMQTTLLHVVVDKQEYMIKSYCT